VSITDAPAADIRAAVEGGRVTAVEVVEAHLAAIEAAAGLNAFTLVDGERALERAAGLDSMLAASEDPGPLTGVPVAIKDLIDHAGRPTTCGSSFYRETPERSATIVERIEAAGGIVIGRTGLHEFAFGFSSENPWFGPVRNPWDPDTSPGGSSGGSAAAVSARLAPLAVGTDTGGSVRVPAALCGIVGLKATHGRIPLTGVFPLASPLDTVGPIARTVADAAILYRVMAGDDPADPWSSPLPVPVPESAATIDGMRIGVPAEWIDTSLDRPTRIGFEWALERLAEMGAVVETISAPMLVPSRMITVSFRPEVASVHRRWYTDDPGRYGDSVRKRMAAAFDTDPDRYQEALAWRAALRGAFARLLAEYDLLATPTVAARRKVIGSSDMETETGPVEYREALSRFTALVNHGTVPAIALPLASPGEPPPSLQLIGPRWSEALLLGVGMALEETGVVAAPMPPIHA